jgi:hypothetical protein
MRALAGILIGYWLIAVSCTMAHLDRYPGIRLDSVPVALQGNYYLKVRPNSKDVRDSIAIAIGAKGWAYTEGNRREEYTLSDKVILSRLENYYVISLKNDVLPQYWNSWVVLSRHRKIELYPIVSINYKPESDKLARYLGRNTILSGANHDTAYYYEMTDAAFLKYFNKEIKGSKTFEIIRIRAKK